MTSITIYVTHEDYSYIKLEGLSPSELFKKAIIMHKEGEIKQDKFYALENERLKLAIKKLNDILMRAGEQHDS